ncbi:MAG: rhodanese-like domain-containing protein [Actinomycetota bacterium]
MTFPLESSSEQPSIRTWLREARGRIDRVEPAELADELATGAMLIDTRDSADRATEGQLPGALVITRNLLEWRLAPSSPNRLTGVHAQTRVIVVCNDGFSSSIAAANLRHLGLDRAADLRGGYRAWRRLGTET